jgi:hypothetical protein
MLERLGRHNFHPEYLLLLSMLLFLYMNYAGVWCTHQLSNINSVDIAPRCVTAIPSSARKAITWHGTVCSPSRDIMRCEDSTTVLIYRVMDCQATVAVIRLRHSKADNTKDGEARALGTTKMSFYILAFHFKRPGHAEEESRDSWIQYSLSLL